MQLDRTEVVDDALMQRYAAGEISDDELMSTLFDAYYPILQSAARKMRLSPADADEIIQNTFLMTFRHLRDFRATRSFRAWLLSVFRNMTFEHMRDASRRMPLDSDLAESIMSPEPSADDLVISHEQMNTLRNAIDGLKPADAQILLLRFVEEKSFAEIASLIGVSPAYVRVLIYRAVQRLRRKLTVGTSQ